MIKLLAFVLLQGSIVLAMGKLGRALPWSIVAADPPELLAFAWGVPAELYRGIVTILVLGGVTLGVLASAAAGMAALGGLCFVVMWLDGLRNVK